MKMHVFGRTLSFSQSIFRLVLIVLFASACDRIDQIGKVASGRYEVISAEELAELKRNADIGKNVGRYSLYKDGFRTWKFDSATGRSCLLLATDEDWKKDKVALQGCRD